MGTGSFQKSPLSWKTTASGELCALVFCIKYGWPEFVRVGGRVSARGKGGRGYEQWQVLVVPQAPFQHSQ